MAKRRKKFIGRCTYRTRFRVIQKRGGGGDGKIGAGGLVAVPVGLFWFLGGGRFWSLPGKFLRTGRRGGVSARKGGGGKGWG